MDHIHCLLANHTKNFEVVNLDHVIHNARNWDFIKIKDEILQYVFDMF